ncbi:MAG: hypothetical protein Q7R56_01980, partial [Nanoarchaeota archaeon]|nr:hypothetical protein [Nanoarchaeota archaeon]
APGLQENNQQIIAVPPQTTKTVYWTLTIPNNLDKNYKYTALIEAEDQYGQQTSNTIIYQNDATITTEEEAKTYIKQQTQHQEQQPFPDITTSCTPNKNYYYTGEQATITCEIKNEGTTTTINACLLETCKEQTLQPRQSISINYNLEQAINGRIPFTISNENYATTIVVPVNVQPLPHITLEPITTDYAYDKTVSIPLHYTTTTTIYNATISIRNQRYTYEEVPREGTIVLSINTKKIINGITITMDYQDSNGKTYHQEAYETFTITDLSTWAKIKIWLYNIFH